MQLDWFTLVAQVINFLVLVWLLRHLLYRRLIGAMDAREANISGRLEDAAHQRAQAEQQAELFRTRNAQFDSERRQMLERAGEEAEAHRKRVMEDARVQAAENQTRWLEALQRERAGLLRDFRGQLAQGVFKLASQALQQLADADLEQQVLKIFEQQIRNLDPQLREAIVAEVRGTGEVEVRTAFALRPQAQEDLTHVLHKQLDDAIKPRFTTVPQLVCGIELRTPSHRVAWNLDAYLEGLEASVFQALDESTGDHVRTR